MFKVLLLHNRYQVRAGEDESALAEARLLRAYGCEVDEYIEDNRTIGPGGGLQTALRCTWSASSLGRVRVLLKQSRYDLVLAQNLFPLISPAVYDAAYETGVPVLQAQRNYRLLCPAATFYRDGRICEDCLGKALAFPALRHACYRSSRAASLAVVTMLAFHRLRRTWQRRVDAFLALSAFARRKLIEGSLPGEKIFVRPNFMQPDPGIGDGSGGYALFAGRLTPEKGLRTLLAAWEDLKIPLRIAGAGELAGEVRQAAAHNPAITYLGRLEPNALGACIASAALLVFPSEWYEGMPRVMVEAFGRATPVLAARLGTMAEMIEDGENGLLFEPGKAEDLRQKVARIMQDPVSLARMRPAGRAAYEQCYTAQRAFDNLMEIYEHIRRSA